jgi:hypothetical protein
MSRMEALRDHTKGPFSETGRAGRRSLEGVLLQPVSFCAFKVNFD